MAFGFRIETWGERALFTRPELSVERMSYDVITPSAARGLIESIYWHPGIHYRIDRIHVLNKISFSNVRRNEIASKAQSSALRTALTSSGDIPYINAKDDIQQCASLILTNVHYVIDAHFELTDKAAPGDNPGKFADIIHRRLRKGQCYSQPYFGMREFPAYFREYDEESDPRGYYSNDEERDMGLMLFDMDYSDHDDIMPMFFRAVMHNGVIDVANSEVYS